MKPDIEDRIRIYFTDFDRVVAMINKLEVKSNESDRLIRCILYLSDSDYDSVESWVKKTNANEKEIINYAELDWRNERKWNFNIPFDQQKEYDYRNK